MSLCRPFHGHEEGGLGSQLVVGIKSLSQAALFFLRTKLLFTGRPDR